MGKIVVVDVFELTWTRLFKEDQIVEGLPKAIKGLEIADDDDVIDDPLILPEKIEEALYYKFGEEFNAAPKWGFRYEYIDERDERYGGKTSDDTESAAGPLLSYDGKSFISQDGKTLVEITNWQGDFVIPGGVTSIGENAFAGCESLASIAIPASVTSIGNDAFSGCTGLTSVTIPDSVTRIGKSAFSGCTGLTSVTIPDSVTSIGDSAFYGCCSLMSVTIPDSVTSIGDSAFYGCCGLTSVTIPDSVTSIGDYAFSDCSGLTSVTIPDSVTSIGDNAFSFCNGLSSVTIADIAAWCGIKFTNDFSQPLSYAHHLFLDGREVTNLVIPAGVSSIGNHAFSGCTGLTSVTIPDSVKSIGNNAFSGCKRLASIAIPTSVTSIGNNAFSGCSDLASVTIPNSVTSIGNNAFEWCDSLKSITIPASVTNSCSSLFSGCRNITSFTVDAGNPAYSSVNGLLLSKDGSILIRGVNRASIEIPQSVTSINDYAFFCCNSLMLVTIPASVTDIERSAFFECSNITSFTVDAGNPAYSSVNGLLLSKDGSTLIHGVNRASVEIPASVTSIIPFERYSNISSFTVDAGNPAYSSVNGMLLSKDGSILIRGVNRASVEIPNSVKTIDDSAFSYCSRLMSVKIPDSVDEIGRGAFSDCNPSLYDTTTVPGMILVDGWAIGVNHDEFAKNLDLTKCRGLISDDEMFSDNEQIVSVKLPKNTKRIGDQAFWCCHKLASITIPDSVTVIEREAFNECHSLQSIVLPNGVTSIGFAAFLDCRSLKSVTIPDSVTSIGESAFSGCSALTSVTIPDSVKEIGGGAFKGCSALTSVAIMGDKTLLEGESLVGSVFEGCKSVRKIVVPGNVVLQSIFRPWDWEREESREPDSIDLLEEVVVADGSTCIADGAFAGCKNLKTVTIPASVTSIGENAFADCESLASIAIPASVTSIGNGAFPGCKNISLDAGNTTFAFVNGFLLSKDGKTLICGRNSDSAMVPDGVTTIYANAFKDCDKLKCVKLPISVKKIGEGAFAGCSAIRVVVIPGQFRIVDTFPDTYAKIETVNVTEGCKHICSGFVEECSNIEYLWIPESVETFAHDAFYNTGSNAGEIDLPRKFKELLGDYDSYYDEDTGEKVTAPFPEPLRDWTYGYY